MKTGPWKQIIYLVGLDSSEKSEVSFVRSWWFSDSAGLSCLLTSHFFGEIPCWFLECTASQISRFISAPIESRRSKVFSPPTWLAEHPSTFNLSFVIFGIENAENCQNLHLLKQVKPWMKFFEISRGPVSLVTRCWRPIKTLASTAEKWDDGETWPWVSDGSGESSIEKRGVFCFPCPWLAVLQAMFLRIAGTLTCQELVV